MVCHASVAIKETKWFGKGVWQANGHTFLHSGCSLPSNKEPAVRNKSTNKATLAFSWTRDNSSLEGGWEFWNVVSFCVDIT